MQLFRMSFFSLFAFACLLIHARALPMNNPRPGGPLSANEAIGNAKQGVHHLLDGQPVSHSFAKSHATAFGEAVIEGQEHAKTKDISRWEAHLELMQAYHDNTDTIAKAQPPTAETYERMQHYAAMHGAHYHLLLISAPTLKTGVEHQPNGGSAASLQTHGTASSGSSLPRGHPHGT